jgi:hypothetical protein
VDEPAPPLQVVKQSAAHAGAVSASETTRANKSFICLPSFVVGCQSIRVTLRLSIQLVAKGHALAELPLESNAVVVTRDDLREILKCVKLLT